MARNSFSAWTCSYKIYWETSTIYIMVFSIPFFMYFFLWTLKKEGLVSPCSAPKTSKYIFLSFTDFSWMSSCRLYYSLSAALDLFSCFWDFFRNLLNNFVSMTDSWEDTSSLFTFFKFNYGGFLFGTQHKRYEKIFPNVETFSDYFSFSS